MPKRLGPWAIVGLLFILVGGLVAWRVRASGDGERVDNNAALSTGAEHAVVAPPLVATGDGTAVRREAEPESTDLTFTGRCVDAAGSPIAEVSFVLERWSRDRRTRRIEELPNVEARSDASGRIALRSEHRDGNSFACAIQDPRILRQTWRWEDLSPGTRTEMGDIVVQAGVVLRGRVLDLHGEPIVEHWTVELCSLDDPGSDPRPKAEAEGSERFEISAFPAGRWRVTAKLPSFDLCELDLELVPGETREVELRQRNARKAASEIVVEARTSDWFPGPDRKYARLVLPGGAHQTPAEHHQGIVFADLEPGSYRVEIADPRFEPWSADDVSPGPEPVLAHLKGSSRIQLRVVDGRSGAPVERFAFELIEYQGGGLGLSQIDSLEDPREQTERPNGLAIIPHLVAGRLLFVLQANGYPARTVEVPTLQPGENRSLTVELFRGTTVEGQVRRAGSGLAVEAALVALFAPAAVDDGPESAFLPSEISTSLDERHRREVARTTSDDLGRFRFEAVQPGSWILTATSHNRRVAEVVPMDPTAPCAKVEGVRVDGVRAVSGLVIELPEPSSLFGTARIPDGCSPPGVGIVLWKQRANGSADFVQAMKGVGDAVWLEKTGEYRFMDLAPGQYHLCLAYPGFGSGESSEGDEHLRNSIALPIAEIELAPGTNVRRDLDLGPYVPSRIEARLRVRGGPRPFFSLFLEASPGSVREGYPLFQQAHFDEDGLAIHPRVAPGSKFVFAEGDGKWIHIFATNLEVTSGSRHELLADIELHTGEIEVLDAAGQPLRDADVFFAPSADPRMPDYNYGGGLELDGHARAELSLPAGRYRVSKFHEHKEDPEFSTEIDWPAGSLVTVRLTKRK